MTNDIEEFDFSEIEEEELEETIGKMCGGAMMNRKEITKFLGDILVSEKFSGMGKYWAKEVTLDYGHGRGKEKRVDFMQFETPKQMEVSDLEKGIFICYEIKSCKADFTSGFGQNFIGEKNYFVMPMSLYREVVQEILKT